MVRPRKKSWKLFTKKQHRSLKDDVPVTAAVSVDFSVGKAADRDVQIQQEVSKKGRSWLGRKTSKKQSKKSHSQNQSHNDTFQTVGTEEGASDHGAVTTMGGQPELFPTLPGTVPKELEVGLRPASDDESSRAELEIWQNSVKDGAELGSEGVEASVVARSRSGNYSRSVDDPFSSIRVIPFGADAEGATLMTGRAESTPPEIPPVKPFPAFEEAKEIPRFWKDEEESMIDKVNHCMDAPLAHNKHTDFDFLKPSTAKSNQFEDAKVLQKRSDSTQFEDADESLAGKNEREKVLQPILAEEETLEPSVETHIPAAPAIGNFAVDSEVIFEFPVSFPEVDAPVVLPEDDASGDRYFLEVSAEDKAPPCESSTAPEAALAVSSEEDKNVDLAPTKNLNKDTEQSLIPLHAKSMESVDSEVQDRCYPLDRQKSDNSIPVLSPSQVSSRRTAPSEPELDLDAPILQTAPSNEYDYSVSSESGSIKWSPSDLESKEHESKASGATEALSLIPSSSSQQCTGSNASIAAESPRPAVSVSGISEVQIGDVEYENEYHCRADEEIFSEVEKHHSQCLSDHQEMDKTESFTARDLEKEVEISDRVGSYSSEPKRTNELGTIDMIDGDKLALVKRVSSVGHLSVGQHSVSNSEIVTPVRQNYRKGFHKSETPLYTGKELFPPGLPRDGDSLSESISKDDTVHDSSPPEYFGATEEHKEEWNDGHTASGANLHEEHGDSLKVKWVEEEVAGKVDWPEEDEDFSAHNGSGNMDRSIRHSESEDSQETLPSLYKQRTIELANRKKQARELRKRGSVFVDEEECARIPGFPFITGIRMGALTSLAGDFDCSYFAGRKHADDESDDGSGIAEGTFEEEDESLVSYDDEETFRDEETYRTTGSTWTRETGNDGIDQALRWADENFLCNES